MYDVIASGGYGTHTSTRNYITGIWGYFPDRWTDFRKYAVLIMV